MQAKKVHESIGDLLKPRGASDVLDAIKNLPVKEKLKKIKEMQSKWGEMYKGLLDSPEVLKNIRDEVTNELSKLDILAKVNYIEGLEKDLPDIFSNMKDKSVLNDLKTYILNQDFNTKSKLVWRFFKSWPDLFKDVEDDPKIDPETNQLLLLFKIKGAINSKEVDKLQSLIQEMGKRYGRETVLDKASSIEIPEGFGRDNLLFNQKDIEQLKLSLYKETRSEDELNRDEFFDVYAFIGYPNFVEKEVAGEILHKKQLGIENLVKLDKYNAASLSQVPMMKVRAQHQGEGLHRVWGVYIPKYMWDKDYAHDEEIDDNLRKFIDENKFKL